MKQIIIFIIVLLNINPISSQQYQSEKLLYNKIDKIELILNKWENVKLSKENIIKLAIELEISNIDIFFTQTIIESGNLKSRISTANNNLLGMKMPKQRKTYAISSKYGYAVYKSWVYCIGDYKIWQNKYVKSKTNYINFLNKAKYCESPNYGNKIYKLSKVVFGEYKEFYKIEKQKFIQNKIIFGDTLQKI